MDALAANNWDRAVIKPFLCENSIIRDRTAKFGITFDLYQNYDGVKGIGNVKVVPITPPPDMAMDTFIPIVFNKSFVPFSNMPDHVAYHGTCIQLQTQEPSKGKWCLQGWGRNDLPVNPDQTEDFLNYKGIYSQN